ncbi:TadE/TadG family type IV pilus assembly protein [Roseinatronobacter bogoriensis]|uniref:TadE-like domain-containing protein n=1 Tax=Roseinatronobacter bogoriensis subsp. barguzinensis TaxID=441209 RepID=A0A2K8K6Q1_9RHOB|nr:MULTISPECIES: TadE/TadG family type IV pilus assembly protein [Rhodobaca]ATX65142.1 hypothetical protein BG454_04295 [Rhodobaca barguzinensis]MBB4209636.1 hypothetical protein [Rhodobaca bogoriensis DSM 18756]TDW35373.1 TadE-like protein [Rhodobaca barguzinensis]TDY66583.1 TadE-like protein [Rhodobaca bogoriensis DSM 18756]
MTRIDQWRKAAARLWREDGAVTVEFVVIFPLFMAVFLLAVDTGISKMRQVFLDRAIDLSVREVRLGQVSEQSSLASMICERTRMLPDCENNITVEMQPISTADFSGLNDPIKCVDREQQITPAVTFNPGAGGQAQELMLIRVCVVVDPFIKLTKPLAGISLNEKGELVLIGRSVFVNEPRV